MTYPAIFLIGLSAAHQSLGNRDNIAELQLQLRTRAQRLQEISEQVCVDESEE